MRTFFVILETDGRRRTGSDGLRGYAKSPVLMWGKFPTCPNLLGTDKDRQVENLPHDLFG